MNNAINHLKKVYMVSDEPIIVSKRSGLVIPDGEVGILRKYGLGTNEADLTPKNALEARKFKKVDFNDFDFPLTVHEKAKLQHILNRIHSKIINQSHLRTSGGVSPIFQPYLLGRFPLLKAGALFTQLAYTGNTNTLRLMKDNYKNKNNWRTWAFSGIRYGWTPFLVYTLSMLFNSRDPGELDETKRARIFRMMQYGDVGNLASFTWGILNKEAPLSNPFLPFASHDAIFGKDGIGDLMMDAIRAGFSKIGDPRDMGHFSSWFIRNDIEFSGVEKTGKKIIPLFKQYKDKILNWNNSYNVNQATLDNMQRTFKNEINPWGQIQVIKTATGDVYYGEMKDAFLTLTQGKGIDIGHEEITKEDIFNLLDNLDFEHFNRTVLTAMQNIYAQKLMQPGMTDKRARDLAAKSIDSKIR